MVHRMHVVAAAVLFVGHCVGDARIHPEAEQMTGEARVSKLSPSVTPPGAGAPWSGDMHPGETLAAVLARGVDHKVVPLLWVLHLYRPRRLFPTLPRGTVLYWTHRLFGCRVQYGHTACTLHIRAHPRLNGTVRLLH